MSVNKSNGIIFISMSVQKVGEILLWKMSNFLSGAFLLAVSEMSTKCEFHERCILLRTKQTLTRLLLKETSGGV